MKNRLLLSCCLGTFLGFALVIMPLIPFVSEYGDSELQKVDPVDTFTRALEAARVEGHFDGEGLDVEDETEYQLLPSTYILLIPIMGCLAGFTAYYFTKTRLK